MKVWDCIIYNGERDALDLRLNILRNVVDFHVLAEAPYSFSGEPKPMYFARAQQSRPRVVWQPMMRDALPGSWDNEYALRERAVEYVRKHADSEDLVILADVDEIPNPYQLRVGALYPTWYYYYLNVRCMWQDNNGAVIVKAGMLQEYSAQELRMNVRWDLTPLRSGWHFSFLGGLEQMHRKIRNWSHTEHDTEVIHANLSSRLSLLKDPIGRAGHELQVVPVDDTFPAVVRLNVQRFCKRGLIHPW